MANRKVRTLPPLRVSDQMRADAESVLAPGETLSAFVHESVARNIDLRRAQREFVERGLASAERARATGEYVAPAAVIKRLRTRLAKAKRSAT